MSESARALPGLPGLLLRQLIYQTHLLLRTPRAVAGGLVLPLLLLVLREGNHPGNSSNVAGVAAFGLLSTAYITHTSALVGARQAGVLKRWRATPLPTWCFFAGRLAATVLVAVVGGLVTVLVAAGLHDVHLHAASLPGLLLALIFGAVTWAMVGTAASTLIPSVEAAWPLLGLTYLPLVVLSGSFGAVTGLPDWLSGAIRYLPAQPLIDSTSRALQGGLPFSAHGLTVELAWAAFALLAAQRWFSWAPHPPGTRRPARQTP
jgi:ABC-2 type transport system permease protein